MTEHTDNFFDLKRYLYTHNFTIEELIETLRPSDAVDLNSFQKSYPPFSSKEAFSIGLFDDEVSAFTLLSFIYSLGINTTFQDDPDEKSESATMKHRSRLTVMVSIFAHSSIYKESFNAGNYSTCLALIEQGWLFIDSHVSNNIATQFLTAIEPETIQ